MAAGCAAATAPPASRARTGRIAITVKRVAGGKLSQHLCDHATVGTWLDIGPAFGGMTLPAPLDAPLLFLAAGSGITPLMSMTRALVARGMPVALTLLYWARRRDELCFVEELRELAREHAGFKLRFFLTGDAASSNDEGEGRIDAAQLASHVPDLASRRVFACGPTTSSRPRVCWPHRMHAASTAKRSPRRASPTAATLSGNVQVTLAASQRVLTVPRGSSLLDALEAAGLSPAHPVAAWASAIPAPAASASGSTRHLHTGALEHEPVTALRLCVNRAASDLILDL
jgi:ferredoxin-NADP reductase